LCVNCLKSESPNLLEPSGPVKVYNGIALPLPLLDWEIEMLAQFWWGILNEKGYLENRGIDARVISNEDW
jgi:hypothetical protein